MIQTIVFDTKPCGREDDQRAALAKVIPQKFRLPSNLPAMGEVIELRA